MNATVAVACHAMATRFEIVLHGESEPRLRAAGEEALGEIQRIEQVLSVFIPSSEIAAINARAHNQPVRVSAEVFRLLNQAKALSEATGGAFDITVGPLLRCWDVRGRGKIPSPTELSAARAAVGIQHLALDPDAQTIRFKQPGMGLDLGAIGKGHAIDQAVEILREAGVTSAFVHGGTSTAYGLGVPRDAAAWRVRIDENTTIDLTDQALSVSKPSGRSFQIEGKTYGHVMDPRSGEPVQGAVLAAVVLPSATETDALSTALLVLGSRGEALLRQIRPEARIVVREAVKKPD